MGQGGLEPPHTGFHPAALPTELLPQRAGKTKAASKQNLNHAGETVPPNVPMGGLEPPQTSFMRAALYQLSYTGVAESGGPDPQPVARP